MNIDGLTREQVLAMEEGPELNVMVQKYVFKSDVFEIPAGWAYRTETLWHFIPHYSSSISAAFKAWEHDRPEDWHMDLHWSNGKYVAEIIKQNEIDGYQYLAQVEADTAAEAMSKCRLLAVMDG